MDRDFDGRLSFAELMGEETPVEKLFKLMDKNGDGFVSKKVSHQVPSSLPPGNCRGQTQAAVNSENNSLFTILEAIHTLNHTGLGGGGQAKL